MHVLLASYCLLPPHPVCTSSNQSCSTEHEGERGECAARPNYFLSAKSTLRVHESLLVPYKNFHPARRPTATHRTYQHVVLSTRKQTRAHVTLSTRKEANQRTRRKHCSIQEFTVARAENTIACRKHWSSQKSLRNHCSSTGTLFIRRKFLSPVSCEVI
jgi:hypothetical protein